MIENNSHDADSRSLISSPAVEEDTGGSGGTKLVVEEDRKTVTNIQDNSAVDFGPESESMVQFDNKMSEKPERSNTFKPLKL